jgi:hypothetical protein
VLLVVDVADMSALCAWGEEQGVMHEEGWCQTLMSIMPELWITILIKIDQFFFKIDKVDLDRFYRFIENRSVGFRVFENLENFEK